MSTSRSDPVRSFWWWWLLAWSAFFVVFGVAAAWMGSIPPASLWGEWVAQGLFGRPFAEDERALYDFVRGPLGGTIAGSYVMQTALVAGPLRRGEGWAYWTVLAAALTWFVVDSAASIHHGAWFNVVRVNLVGLGVTLVGLVGLGAPPFRSPGSA